MPVIELTEARDVRKKIRDLERKLDALRLSIENIVPVLDGMPHAKDAKSKVERIALQIVETERELDDLRGNFETAKTRLADAIMTEIDDPTGQTLLILRYVSCLSFKEIARRMSYGLRHVFKLHEQLLKDGICGHIQGTLQHMPSADIITLTNNAGNPSPLE